MLKDQLLTQLVDSIFANTVSIGTGLILILAAQSMRARQLHRRRLRAVRVLPGVGHRVHPVLRPVSGALQADRRGVRAHGRAAAGRAAGAIGRARPLWGQNQSHSAGNQTARRRSSLPSRGLLASRCIARSRRPDLPLPRFRRVASKAIDLRLERGSFTVITGRIGSGQDHAAAHAAGAAAGRRGRDALERRAGRRPGRASSMPPRCAYTAQVPRLFSEYAARQHADGPARAGRSICPAAIHAWRCWSRIWPRMPSMGWIRWSARAACGSRAGRCSAPPPRACSCARRAAGVRRPLQRAGCRNRAHAVGASWNMQN